ncbi:MAG: VWA domain-containing protein [Candidatus Zixiibacteriota bacterium]
MKTNRLYRVLPFSLLVILFLFAGSAMANYKIRPHVDPDRPYINADRDESVYLVVKFDLPELDKRPDDRPDLNLGLVIDRSGSMEERGKMSYARDAAKTVVDKLSYNDYLAVVEYDDIVSVLWPSSHVESKERIKSRISELYPRGSTNLSGGMMKGVDEVNRSFLRRGINRVLLLSDGLANQGVTDPQAIKRLVKEARRRGITISTMGLGLDYNEDLMQMIAEHAGGRYYFIENPKQMHAIFEQELGTIFATVAKNVKARLRLSGSVRHCQVFGYVHENNGRSVDIEIGDLYAGEEVSVVLKLDVDPQDPGSVYLGDIEFSYTDVNDNNTVNESQRLSVRASRDETIIEKNIDKDVTVEAALVEADAIHDEQIRLYEQGDIAQAQSNIAMLNDHLMKINTSYADPSLSAKIEALDMENEEMKEAEESAEGQSSYLKKSKARTYQAQKGNRSSYVMQDGDSGFEVEQLQRVLTDNGYYSGPIDGVYDKDVSDAVKSFQTANSIAADGIAGPKTLKAAGLY